MTPTRFAMLLVVAASLAGCFAPPSNGQKVTEAARELNVNSRFGRMDMAASYASPAARQAFLERRATWGNLIRVMDVELASLDLDEEEERALVEVVVSWMRVDESQLRATRVAQVWRSKDGDWQLTREKRVAGDLGLFGEHVEVVHPEIRDVQYPTTTLR
jgi:hypothetical protein